MSYDDIYLLNTLMVDEIPSGAIPQYERDSNLPALVFDGKKIQYIKDKEVILPTFTLRASTREKLNVKENRIFMDMLKKSFKYDRKYRVINCKKSQLASKINIAFRQIEQHDLVVCKILMNKKSIKDLPKDIFDENAEFISRTRLGLMGHLYTANVIASSFIPERHICCLPDTNILGSMAVIREETRYGKGKNGNPIVELEDEIGMALLQPQYTQLVKYY